MLIDFSFLFSAEALKTYSANDSTVPILGGGILAMMIIREVLTFLKNRKESEQDAIPSWFKEYNQTDRNLHEMLTKMVVDLHHWHSPDSAGEQTWKNKSMIFAVQELKIVINSNSVVIEKLTRVIERLEEFEKERLRFTDRELARMHHDRASVAEKRKDIS